MSWRRWRPAKAIAPAARVGVVRRRSPGPGRCRRPSGPGRRPSATCHRLAAAVPAWKTSAPVERASSIPRPSMRRRAGVAPGSRPPRARPPTAAPGSVGSIGRAGEPPAGQRAPRAAASSSGPERRGQPRQDGLRLRVAEAGVALEQDGAVRRSASGRRTGRHGTACRDAPARPGSGRGWSPMSAAASVSGRSATGCTRPSRRCSGPRSPSASRLWSRATGSADRASGRRTWR